jgi:hypothetical protein
MTESQATKPLAPVLGSGGISLTFTAKKKPSIVVQVQEVEKQQEKDFITGVEGTKIKRYADFFLSSALRLLLFIAFGIILINYALFLIAKISSLTYFFLHLV